MVNNIKRIERSRKKLEKATRRLEVAIFRRKQAMKGNVIKALFGKLKRRKN